MPSCVVEAGRVAADRLTACEALRRTCRSLGYWPIFGITRRTVGELPSIVGVPEFGYWPIFGLPRRTVGKLPSIVGVPDALNSRLTQSRTGSRESGRCGLAHTGSIIGSRGHITSS
jgi:hypothetical protein